MVWRDIIVMWLGLGGSDGNDDDDDDDDAGVRLEASTSTKVAAAGRSLHWEVTRRRREPRSSRRR